jgi:hypothetical protein
MNTLFPTSLYSSSSLWTIPAHPRSLEIVSWNVEQSESFYQLEQLALSDLTSSRPPPAITAKSARNELLSSVLPSVKIIFQDLCAYPLVSIAIFAGVGLAATLDPFPYFDKTILALGSATALWMLRKGVILSRQAIDEQSQEHLNAAKTEFGIGALSLLIMGATLIGLEAFETSTALQELQSAGHSNKAIKAMAGLIHSGDEIVAGIAIFKRLSPQLFALRRILSCQR